LLSKSNTREVPESTTAETNRLGQKAPLHGILLNAAQHDADANVDDDPEPDFETTTDGDSTQAADQTETASTKKEPVRVQFSIPQVAIGLKDHKRAYANLGLDHKCGAATLPHPQA